jgi:hypothetical protein
MAHTALKESLESSVASYELKFYIQDNNGNWVDFTDRAEWQGKNQLRNIGSLTYTAERLRGQLQQKFSAVTLDSSDGFWDRPFPASLKASYDSNWEALNATAASFSTSANGKETVLYRHKAALRAHYFLTQDMIPQVVTLGVSLIEDCATNSADKSATLSFVPLSHPLTEADAAQVKNGNFWHLNANVNRLVRELLEENYADSSGNLPSTWEIDEITSVHVPDDDSDAWTPSHMGRPPERVYDYNNDGPSWTQETRVSEAMCHWEYNTGTISVTAGSNVISGSGTSWSTSSGNLQNDLRVGDALIIRKRYTTGDAGSVYANSGYYTIVSVDSTTQITLDKSLPGTADESGLAYAIVRLYVGVGSDLYEYNIATDTYRQLTTSPTQLGGTEYKYRIRRLWFNVNDTSYPIWGAALTQPQGMDETERYSLKIFRFKWDGTTPVVDLWGTKGSVEMGEYIHREGDYYVPGSWAHALVGDFSGGTDSDQSPMTIPFEQYVNCLRNTNSYFDLHRHQDNNYTEGVTDIAYAEGGSSQLVAWNVPRARVGRGYYGAVGWGSFGVDPELTCRYTVGQDGFLVFNPNKGTNGSLAYCAMVSPAVDTNASKNTMTTWRVYTYHTIDLSQSDPAGGAPSTAAMCGDSDFAIDHMSYIPTCGTYDDDGNWYVGLYRDQQYYATTGDEPQCKIFKIEAAGGGSSATLIYHKTDTSVDSVLLEMMYTTNADGDGMLYASRLRQEAMMDANPYDVVLHPDPDTPSVLTTLTVKETSDYQAKGLARMDIGGGTPNYRIFFHEGGTGIIHSCSNVDEATSTSKVIDYPINDYDTYALGQCVWISSVLEGYWISAMTPCLEITSQTEGLHLLCKWSSMMSVRVDLADFTGIKSWDALRYLADLANAAFGFNPDGTFFFKQKPRHIGSSYTFSNVDGNKRGSIQKKRGQAQIVNHSSRIPGHVRMGDIEISIQLKSTSIYGQGTTRHTMNASQRDLLPKTLTLVCMQGGKIKQSGSDTDSRARFKYRLNESDIEGVLSTAYTSGYALSIDTPDGVRFGSRVYIEGVDSNGDEITADAYAGIQATYPSGQLQVNSAVKTDDYLFELKLSSGTLDLTDDLENIGRPLKQGDVLAIGSFDSTDNWEYVRISEIDAANDKVGVTRSVYGDAGGIAHAASENVYLLRNGQEIYLDADLGQAFSKGDAVAMEQPTKETLSLELTYDPTDASSGQSAYAIFDPVLNEFSAIGGENQPNSSHMALQFGLPSDVTDDNEFSVGDVIRVSTPGLQLTPDAPCTQTKKNVSSIEKWGKKESQLANNPYMNVYQAKWAVKREVRQGKDPHYIFTTTTIAAPWISMLDVVDLQDPDALQMSDQHKEACYISQMVLNPKKKATMQLTLCSVNAY